MSYLLVSFGIIAMVPTKLSHNNGKWDMPIGLTVVESIIAILNLILHQTDPSPSMEFHNVFGPFNHPAQNTPRHETISDIILRALLRYPDRPVPCPPARPHDPDQPGREIYPDAQTQTEDSDPRWIGGGVEGSIAGELMG
jgi:hypothetical protein